MKKFLLKILDIVLTVIMIFSALYAVFNLVMAFLPGDVQTSVYGWLNINTESIATLSISAIINAAVLVSSKLLQTYNKIALTAELAKSKNVISQDTAVNKIVIDRQNAIINNLNCIENLINALLSVQKVTTERNIKASDKLVYTEDKNAYKQALEEIEKAKKEFEEINNISSVYEKIEVKEILVEKTPEDELNGRV